jgi:hypothetical protein
LQRLCQSSLNDHEVIPTYATNEIRFRVHMLSDQLAEENDDVIATAVTESIVERLKGLMSQ